MTLITVLLDTDIQLFFYYCSYSLVGTVSFDMTGQNTNSVSQLAFCYIVSPLMMRLMQNVFTCIKLSQQARIWFALESISLSNDRTQFHYIFSDDIVQFNLNHFKWHNTIQSHQFFLVQMDWTQNLDLKFFHGNVWLVGWSHDHESVQVVDIDLKEVSAQVTTHDMANHSIFSTQALPNSFVSSLLLSEIRDTEQAMKQYGFKDVR